MRIRLLLIFLCFGLTACDAMPKDPNKTLENIRAHKVLRVGVLYNPPWAQFQPLEGIEIKLLNNYAKQLNVKPVYQHVSLDEGLDALQASRLHILAGGLTTDSGFHEHTALTRPYIITEKDGKSYEHILAVPRGENAFITDLERYFKSPKLLQEDSKETLKK